MSPFSGPSSWRIGLGFDFHRFSDAGTLILGGMPLEGYPALAGHSDADVLVHAAMDAVLGAAGEVDIGTLFPDTDETYLNACSKDLARQVVRIVEEAGFRIVNLDTVLVCDRPMIAPYRPKIRASLAEAFGVDIAQVNVKGKSNEGQSGRGRGIEAMAVALLKKPAT
jgi:2-C-methyl-D-erythritol 2,4-cyclodiphosphate synthase